MAEITPDMEAWIEANPAPPLTPEQERRTGLLIRAALEQPAAADPTHPTHPDHQEAEAS